MRRKFMILSLKLLALLFCHECEFPADDLHDLGQHMYEDHMDDNEKKLDCHYCDETFTSKDGAMKHRK